MRSAYSSLCQVRTKLLATLPMNVLQCLRALRGPWSPVSKTASSLAGSKCPAPTV